MEESAQQPITSAPKPTNWYSGWRVFATAAATFIAAKLFGVAGALVAVLLFLWLQPKRGTWQALAAAAVAGVAVAAVLSVALLREQPGIGTAENGGAAKQATPEQWMPAPPNLKPFEGKLDGEK